MERTNSASYSLPVPIFGIVPPLKTWLQTVSCTSGKKREEIVPTTDNIPAYILGMVRHKCIDALRTRQQHLLTHQRIYQLGMRSIRENLAAFGVQFGKSLFVHVDFETLFSEIEGYQQL